MDVGYLLALQPLSTEALGLGVRDSSPAFFVGASSLSSMNLQNRLLERVRQYEICGLDTTISPQSGSEPRRKALLRLLAKLLSGTMWALQNSPLAS